MMNKKKKVLLIAFIIHHSAFIILFAGCGVRRTPNLERIFADARAREGKRPVIVIPGILGSQLVNRQTNEVVWPSAFRSANDELSLPVSPDLAANRDELYAVKIVDVARLARLSPEVYVYHELLDALRRYGGYHEGNWDAPAPDGDRDTFYIFPYDWRRDNVETARELVRRVEELKRKLNRPDLRFNVVAHSMGGLVARYAAMYGDDDLPTENAGPMPTWAGASFISKVFMMGTPNQGSAEAFAALLDGFSITEGLRRRVRLLNMLSREDALTIQSLFQLLPNGDAARFLDENLQPLAGIDLYDPVVWARYGWGAINDPDYRERFARGRVHGLNKKDSQRGGSLDELDAYLAAVLNRAKRFHEALNAATASNTPQPVPLFAFGGDCEETLAAPVILRDAKRGRWVTLTGAREFRTAANARVSRKEVIRAMYEPGDGRVTRRSLLGERSGTQRHNTLFDTALPVAYAVFVCDLHSELQNNKVLQDNALTLLVNEVIK